MSLNHWIDKANGRLKGSRVKLFANKNSNWIAVQGTFPPQPWEQDQRRRQRRISLGFQAHTEADVKKAEYVAKQIDLDLNNNTFSWEKFGKTDPEQKPTTIAQWLRVYKEQKSKAVSNTTWAGYERIMRSLPGDKELSVVTLISWILNNNPSGNTNRHKYLTIALGLCELAGLDPGDLVKLRKEIPTKPINPRNLPTYKQVEQTFSRVPDSWKWVYGMIAVYGLRPHEIFRLDTSDFPDIRVLENSKTGTRIVTPIRPKWIEIFALVPKIQIPENLEYSLEIENTKLGRKIGDGFRRYNLGDPYNLRHLFAQQCVEIGLTSDVAAKLMGHSREIHERTYRAFIKHSVYVNAAKIAVDRAGDRD